MFKFLYDWALQEASTLFTEEEKQHRHLRIGSMLPENTDREQVDESICEIVDNLNSKLPLLMDKEECYKLAGLNMEAGRKAMGSMAYKSALLYLTTGIKLLPEESWQERYELSLSLHVEGAEMAYLSADYTGVEALTKIVLHNASSLPDKVVAYEIIIQSYSAQGRFKEAITAYVGILKKFGVSLPVNPGKLHILFGLLKVMLALRGKSVEDLYRLPRMTDPNKLAAMRILRTIMFSFFDSMNEMIPLLAFTAVSLSIKFGNSFVSPFAYAMYGIVLGGFKDIKRGHRFGSMAIDLTRKYAAENTFFRIKIIYYALIHKWKGRLADTLEILDDIYQKAFEAGDFESAAIIGRVYCTNLLYSGGNLKNLEETCSKYVEKLKKNKNGVHHYSIGIIRQASMNLIGGTEYKTRLIGEGFNEDKVLPILTKDANINAIMGIWVTTCMISYLFEDYTRAFENFQKMDKQHEKSGYFGSPPEVQFYFSLTILAIYSGFGKQLQKRYLRKLDSFQKIMGKWAKHAPMNFLHKWQLIEAERARINNDELKAAEFYDLAIAGAKENEYIQEEALANELAARFYLSKRREKISHLYMKAAHYCYTKWGAEAKVRDIEEKYPMLLACPSREIKFKKRKLHFLTGSTGLKPGNIDFTTMMKASRAISGEIILENLLEKLMRIAIEAAGAEKGFLLLEKEEEYIIRAKGELTDDTIKITQFVETVKNIKLPEAVLNYVVRTGESLVLHEAENDDRFRCDSYIMNNRPKSILCTPLIHQDRLKGIIYLENNLTGGSFTNERIEVIKQISSQAVISLDNALLYQNLLHEKMEHKDATHKINRLASIVESTKDGVIGISMEGIIRSWNSGANRIYGYATEEIRGQHISILTTEACSVTLNAIIKRIRERETSVQYEMVHITKENLSIDVSLTISPVREASDTITDIAIISRDITVQKRLEQEVLEISTQEQKRIGQALHDNLGQELTGLAYKCKILEKDLAGKLTEEATLAGEITKNVNKIISQTHSLAVNLFQIEIIPENLIEVLNEMVSGIHKLFDIHVRFEYNDNMPVSDSFLATHLFRIVQESVNNAVKHSKAKNILIELLSKKNETVLSVSDDGTGLIESQLQGKGIGLRIMRYRAGMIRASFIIQSDQGKGTTVILRVPEK